MNIFVFDIETIPDTESGKKLFGLQGLKDKDIAKAMIHLRQQESGSEFLPHHLQRIIAISIAMRSPKSFKVWTLGQEDSSEAELLERFYEGLRRFDPTLVSWNGGGFDLPVIHYRSLKHGVSAPRYWEVGQEDTSFRYNNYLGRFHWRHIDLMDVLSGYQPRAFAPLDQVASMLGLPGKMGMSGAKVWQAYLEGQLASIRDYCETDVLNTYLVYQRFQLLRGHLDQSGYQRECDLVKETLKTSDRPHLNDFLASWEAH
jgi:predicted PolB exonuclease-like 3'-5' exonuclease